MYIEGKSLFIDDTLQNGKLWELMELRQQCVAVT